MNKSELQNRYDILSKILDDFYDAKQDYQYGNAKTKRLKENKLNSLISLAQKWIIENDEFYNIITGTDKKSEFERIISLEGTFTLNYFGKDMSEILDKLKIYISNHDL
ncbi:hypothetical protein [Chryseobacterium indologenes]|uniref:Uncharacterized protein n=1 Tax=Chryseobacterium indologenes TaxID=253 RepID=A0A0N1KRK1_CHRID|nr:hypothetical protein [Chryseobacterium indologenes]KPE50109.1 hypothetical protein AOB46_16860 [Chryseobacterium indologenes]